MTADLEEIRRALLIFYKSGDVVELRVPKAGRWRTISGYFDDLEVLAQSAMGLSGVVPAIYTTINPVKPALLARSANRYQKYAETATADKDIIALRWLAIDLDPVRPSGISSTDEEHDAAITKAKEIRAWLIEERGWPKGAFVLADSGNGGHLPVRIEDLKNPQEDKELLKRCLQVLDSTFSNDTVKVDLTTFNPARIWKLYGTLAMKGDSTPDRPYRIARILEVPEPESLEVVPRFLLEELASMAPKPPETTPLNKGKSNSGKTFDPAKYATDHGATVTRVEQWVDKEGGKWDLAILAECPFDPSHNRGEARIGVRADGKRTFGCFHDACQNKDWYALRDLWEPERSHGKPTGLTVIDAIEALEGVCDGAKTRDGQGFNRFDREEYNNLIEKAISCRYLSPKEEITGFRFLKKYKKQLKGLGIEYDDIGHINPGSIATEEEKGESQATIMVDQALASGAVLWHSSEKESFATISIDGHQENHRLGSNASRQWLSRLAYDVIEKAPSSQAVQDALTVLQGMALFEGEEHEVHTRVAGHDGKIYVDLGTANWEAVEISTDGWKIVPLAPVKFIRPTGMLPLPYPALGGSWDELRELINAPTDEIWIQVVGWLVQAFWPHGPYAHLALVGEQGSIKTTVTKILKFLVDPSKGGLRTQPWDPQSVLIQALWGRVVALDNLSGVVDGWLSDTLCGLSTGTATGKRKLYTDFDQAILEVKRPVIMNGIDLIIPRGDMADRTMFIELPSIEFRREDRDIEAAFMTAHPRILGLILDATAQGLRNVDQVKIAHLPRMADFAVWVSACEPVLPWEPGRFLEVYNKARAGRMLEMVMADPFTRTLYSYVSGKVEPIELTPADLLSTLANLAGVVPDHLPKGWPRDPTRLGTKLRRVSPLLKAVGMDVEISRTYKERVVRIHRHVANHDANDAGMTLTMTLEPAASGDYDADDAKTPLLPYKEEKGMNRGVVGDGGQHKRVSPDSDISVIASCEEAKQSDFDHDANPQKHDANDANSHEPPPDPKPDDIQPMGMCSKCGQSVEGRGHAEVSGVVVCFDCYYARCKGEASG